MIDPLTRTIAEAILEVAGSADHDEDVYGSMVTAQLGIWGVAITGEQLEHALDDLTMAECAYWMAAPTQEAEDDVMLFGLNANCLHLLVQSGHEGK